MKKLFLIVLLVITCTYSSHSLEPDLRTLHNSLGKLAESVPVKKKKKKKDAIYTIKCMKSKLAKESLEENDIPRLQQIISQGVIVCHEESYLSNYESNGELETILSSGVTQSEEKFRERVHEVVLNSSDGLSKGMKLLINDYTLIVRNSSDKITAVGQGHLCSVLGRRSYFNIIISSAVSATNRALIIKKMTSVAIDIFINKARETDKDMKLTIPLKFAMSEKVADLRGFLEVHNENIKQKKASITIKDNTYVTVTRLSADRGSKSEDVGCLRDNQSSMW